MQSVRLWDRRSRQTSGRAEGKKQKPKGRGREPEGGLKPVPLLARVGRRAVMPDKNTFINSENAFPRKTRYTDESQLGG